MEYTLTFDYPRKYDETERVYFSGSVKTLKMVSEVQQMSFKAGQEIPEGGSVAYWRLLGSKPSGNGTTFSVWLNPASRFKSVKLVAVN